MADETALIPAAGATVVIERDGQRHRAKVGRKSPNGAFPVDWYAGRNPHASHLAGHWFARFGPNAEPLDGWQIVEVCGESEPCPSCFGGRLREQTAGERVIWNGPCRRCDGAGDVPKV